MENKNEDSHSSDSLDKTLQQKCKMDDANQCESKPLEPLRGDEATDCVGDGTNINENNQTPEFDQQQNEQLQLQQHQPQNSSMKLLKTENYLMGDGINAVATVARETSLRFFKASSTINNTIFSRDDSDSSSSSSSSGIGSNNNNHNNNNSNSNKGNNSNNVKLKSSGTHSIEKKVKQISQNLQETSLEVEKVTSDEENNSLNAASTSSYCAPLISPSTSAILTSTISTTNLLDNEQPGSLRSDSTSNSESTLSHSEMDGNSLAANDSTEDNSDQRSKKVRFHPDVKENDGGNRIISKKKWKLKLQTNEELQTISSKTYVNCTDMDFDDNAEEVENEEDCDEDDFDIEKTISDAENYLKQHPIIFVPSMPQQKMSTASKVPLPSGLLSEEDLEPLDEEKNKIIDQNVTVEEFNFEDGVECILGKRTINETCSYLLRYIDKTALCWESEDFIVKNCPKLLDYYKKQQQQKQENLMKYVAKRQNLRQRYTDF